MRAQHLHVDLYCEIGASGAGIDISAIGIFSHRALLGRQECGQQEFVPCGIYFPTIKPRKCMFILEYINVAMPPLAVFVHFNCQQRRQAGERNSYSPFFLSLDFTPRCADN